MRRKTVLGIVSLTPPFPGIECIYTRSEVNFRLFRLSVTKLMSPNELIERSSFSEIVISCSDYHIRCSAERNTTGFPTSSTVPGYRPGYRTCSHPSFQRFLLLSRRQELYDSTTFRIQKRRSQGPLLMSPTHSITRSNRDKLLSKSSTNQFGSYSSIECFKGPHCTVE